MAQAAQGQGHGGDQGELRVAVLDVAAPQRFQLLGLQAGRFDMALGGEGGPFFVPTFAAGGAVEVADSVGVDLDLTAIALDHNHIVTEQAAGIAVYTLVTGMEDALQAAAGVQRVEQACREWIGERRPRVLRRSIMRCSCGAQSPSGMNARLPCSKAVSTCCQLRHSGICRPSSNCSVYNRPAVWAPPPCMRMRTPFCARHLAASRNHGRWRFLPA